MTSVRWLSFIGGGFLGLLFLGVLWRSPDTEQEDSLVAHTIPAVLQSGRKASWSFDVCNVADTPRQGRITVEDVSIVQIKEASVTVKPHDCSKIDAEITAPSGSKWISIPILNYQKEIGQLGISTRDAGSLSLALNIADNSELVSIDGREASVIVKSVGGTIPKSIPVSWRLEAGPWYSSGVDEFAAGSRTLLIPIRGQQSLKRWIWQVWPVTKKGTLVFTLGQKELGEPPQELVFAVPVRLALKDATAQGALTTLLVFAPLLAGGLAAYFFNTLVPIERRRRKLRYALKDLKEQLRQLRGKNTRYADLASLIHQDVRRTLETLQSFVCGSPELNAELEQLEAKVQSLQLRSTALRRVLGLPTRPGEGLGLLAVDMIRESSAKVANELRASGKDVASFNAALQELDKADDLARGAGLEQPALRAALSSECEKLQTLIRQLGSDAEWEAVKVDINADLVTLGLGAVREGEYYQREFKYWRARIAFDLHRTGTAPDSIKTTLLSIRSGDWNALDRARVFSASEADVRSAVIGKTPDVRIVCDRNPIHVDELTSFTLWFEDDRLNYSPVRERWHCIWKFDDSTFLGGWTVWRYFSEAKDYGVSVTAFLTDSERIDLNMGSIKVTVMPTTRQAISQPWLSTVSQLLLVQVIPLFALLSSNTDILRTRDPLSAVLMLIAAGFATDTGKSLLAAATTAVANRVTPQVTKETLTPEITQGAAPNSALAARLKG